MDSGRGRRSVAALRFEFHMPNAPGPQILAPGYCDTHPLGGSETAVIRLADALRAAGHAARIHLDWESARRAEGDLLVVSRAWEPLVEGGVASARVALWCHDDTDQPFLAGLRDEAVARRVWERCHRVVCVSHYQSRRWQGDFHLGAENVTVIPNGVDTACCAAEAARIAGRPPRAYYASVPHRGLDHLLTVWPHVRGAVPGAELWVFGYRGLLDAGADDFTRAQHARLEGLEGVRYEGGLGQAALRARAVQCRALAYPSVYAETSCIAALEAMAAGCAVVGTELGALPETAWRNPLVALQGRTLERFALELARVLADDAWYATLARHNLALAPLLDWRHAVPRWVALATHG